MVKNLPTVERSTKIRFGRNAQEDQGENTIVFNASDEQIDATQSGSVYMTPLRQVLDISDRGNKILTYNRDTKEVSDSGVAAVDVLQPNLQATTNLGNTTTNTIEFRNTVTSLVTTANVGIANSSPVHTLDVGSNLYVDDTGSNVLVVNGNTNIKKDLVVHGNTTINGVLTVINTENLSITDAIIELGRNNTSGDTTLDLGLLLNRPGSNVAIGFLEGTDELVFAYTDTSADSKTITPLTSETLDVHVYGRILTESNVGIINTSPVHTLDVGSNLFVDEYGSNVLFVSGNTYTRDILSVGDKVGIKITDPAAELHVVGNVYVSSNLTVDEDTFHVDVVNDSVGVGTLTPSANLHVVGNVYISSNLTVDTETLHVDVVNDSIGVGTKTPSANLHVVGNVYISSNLTVDTETLHVDAGASHVGVNTKTPSANLHVVGNVYVSSNLTVDGDTFHVDVVNDSIGVGTKTPSANLHVVGNVYVSSNLTVDDDTFHVDTTTHSVGVETKNPTSNLHVVGNVYVTSNTTTDGTLTLNHPTTAILTDLNSNVEIKLNQMANVIIDTTTLSSEHVLTYDGQDWTNEYPIHTFIKIKNDAGVTISRGDLVYVKGAQNQNVMNVGLARADDPATMPCIGVVYDETLTQGSEGVAVAYGRAQNVDTSGFLAGETVYVSNVTAGGLSNVKPFYTDSVPNLIQNIGVVAKIGETNGTVFVTGIGRANDVPNAQIVLDEGDINWVYVSDVNNDFQKIEPSNLLTQLQTLQQVTDTGNATSNTIRFTNATTGLVTTSNLNVGSNISVSGLKDPINKYLPMVNHDGFFQRSPVYVTDGGTYVISASEAEFLGNITLSGHTTIISSNNVTIEDRIFGIGANNSISGLDSGIIIEHQDDGTFANLALIHHGDEHSFSIGYTQNTFTDNHILDFTDPTHILRIRLRGNVEVQNNITVAETLDVTGATTFGDDFTVGAVSNLFVDVSTSRVGINEASPTVSLDVGGDARVQSTTDTVSTTGGAFVVLGGIGVASNIHSTNVYVGSHVGVGTVSTTHPVHVMATTTGGMYVNGNGNDARLTLEPSETTKDPVISFNTSGENFSVGIDNSINDTFNIANHATDVGTNVRVAVTPAGNVGIGLIAPSANLHVVGNAYVTSNLTVDGVTKVLDTTESKLRTNGALIVSGGIGVASNVNTTNLHALGTTDSISKSTGTVVVGGGVGITGALFGSTAEFDGITKVTNATESILRTNGALIVSGGIGVASNVNTTNLHALGTTDSISKSTGTVVVGGGVGITGALFGAAATLDGVVTLTNTTQSTSRTTGAVTIAGGLGVSTNVHAANVYVTGGLITNTGGVTKKTYSFTGALTSGQTIADSTIKITFSAHVFYAKVVAHLIESDDEVSTLSMECGGGNWVGETPLTIAKGPTSVFGSASTNPWNSVPAATTTTVALAPTTNMAAAGNYNVFIEYISAHASGAVTNIIEGSTIQITFGY